MIAIVCEQAVQTDAAGTEPSWRMLASGIEYSTAKISNNAIAGDGVLHIVRIDPGKARLRALMSSALDKKRRTARTWCSEFGLVAVINAGMYETDYMTHVGYMKSGDKTNNGQWAKQYHSILAFDPIKPGIAPARIFDQNAGSAETEQYGTLIQNLRLIKGDGVNVWKEQFRTWSEAAVAEDSKGRILFLLSRTPFSMYEFNQKVLSLPLGIIRAMHMEGGPEASLSICASGLQLDLAGSYQSGTEEDDKNPAQWQLPNVIGVYVK